jgi:hypothetical protein
VRLFSSPQGIQNAPPIIMGKVGKMKMEKRKGKIKENL